MGGSRWQVDLWRQVLYFIRGNRREPLSQSQNGPNRLGLGEGSGDTDLAAEMDAKERQD